MAYFNQEMKKDEFGDRMKMYEGIETNQCFIPGVPIYVRLDGRGFSKFTKGMKRPFDEEMSMIMHETVKTLIDKTHAKIGYTQSDEISLLYCGDAKSNIIFNGKKQKLCSVLAGLTSSTFMLNLMKSKFGMEYTNKVPHFDCRVFQLPSKVEVANAFLWREKDAYKNAVSMAAHSVFGHSKLNGKSTDDKINMLLERGIIFDDYPDFFKHGAYFSRVLKYKEIEDEIWNKIPEDKRPSERKVLRSSVERVYQYRNDNIENKVDFIFRHGE